MEHLLYARDFTCILLIHSYSNLIGRFYCQSHQGDEETQDCKVSQKAARCLILTCSFCPQRPGCKSLVEQSSGTSPGDAWWGAKGQHGVRLVTKMKSKGQSEGQ